MTDTNRSFQHYEVLRRDDGTPWELGRGAMGITYKAFDVNLCCEVALKVVNSALLDHPDARERFVREARAAAALRHRNVASVYHLGNDGEHFFYAMEFIDGETLDALVRRQGPLPVHVVLRMLGQVSRALVAADRQQLVHRDLKPTNLMVVHEDADEDMTIKVIDFGLARPAMGAETSAQVTLGGFVGTPQYASPEQLEEQGLDARSDIYSLGVTAWYLLTGQPPFTGSLASVCQQQLGKSPPWEALPSGVPECVHDLLAHMLEKNPTKRPPNARVLRDEIEECLRNVPTKTWVLPPLGPVVRSDGERSTVKTRSIKTSGENAETLANGRYTLLQLLEEGHGTRVYQASDAQTGASLVTLRTLPYQLTRGTRGQVALSDEIRLIQAADHPHLVRILSLEPASDTTPAFLVEEPLVGFSLRDLLAARHGSLSADDTLPLLEQAAAAADHATSRRLDQLDFALHHLRVHFPFSDPTVEPFDSRTFLTLPMERWPEWNLKVHPFRVERDSLEHHTWAGDVTLVPGAVPARADPAEGGQTGPGQPVRHLANLAYELLGGAPSGGLRATGGVKSGSLATLNEAGNTVLTRALSEPGSFANCHDFFRAMSTVGEHPRRRLPAISAPEPAMRSAEIPAGSISVPAPLTPMPVTTLRNLSRTGPASPIAPVPRAAMVVVPKNESVAPFFRPPGTVGDHDEVEGSAWERLSMVGGEPARPGRWLLGGTAAALLFAAAFAGVLALLLRAGPTRGTRAEQTISTPKPRFSPPLTEMRPIPAASAQLAAVTLATPPTRPPEALPRVTVRDVKEPSASFRESPSTVPATAGPPADAQPSPTPEKLVTVQLDSVPPGAEVRLRGQLLGVTPFDVPLPPGDHQMVTSYHGWPETRKTIHLNSGQTRVSVEIPLMPPGLIPLNGPANTPHNGRISPPNPSLERRAQPTAPVRIEPAVPIVPSPDSSATPVRRPLPLEPFERETTRPETHRAASPAPSVSDDDDD